MSRCAASATSLPVGGFLVGEPGSGTVLVLAGVQGSPRGRAPHSEMFLVIKELQALS